MNDRHDEIDDVHFDDEARALLGAMRAEEALPDAVHDRVWARVEASTRPAAPSSARWVWIGVAAAAALMLALVGLRGDTSSRTQPEPPATQAEHAATPDSTGGQLAPAPERATTRRATTPRPSVPTPAPAPSEATPDATPPAAPAATTPRRAKKSADVSLAAELALLERIRAALVAGEPARALKLTGEHARTFPDGAMVQERNGLHAVAQCEAGQRDKGRASARAFLARYPKSTLAERVQAACLADLEVDKKIEAP